jgi:ATP phosphoribosyltransferase regulatory subunit
MLPLSSPAPIRLPHGVRDFLPRAAARRRSIATRLLLEFEAWGYRPVITPLFECADVLERGLGNDARAAAIRFIEPATGEVVALRPDITPQMARLVATRFSELGGPIRLCYEGEVTRIGTGARGQREIMQAGVELVNARGPMADAEVIGLAASCLGRAQVAERTLDVGHVALARLALDNIEDEVQLGSVREALLRKDAAGVSSAARGLPRSQRALLEALPTLFGEARAVFKDADALRLPAAARRAIEGLKESIEAAISMGALEAVDRIIVDLGELRGFEYYTGMRLAGLVSDAGAAVLRGGRYDELIGRYGVDACAVGFAVDIEALSEAEAQHTGTPLQQTTGVLIVPTADTRTLAGKIATSLRANGVRTAIDVGARRSRTASLSYAAEVGLDAVLFVEPKQARLSIGGQYLDLSQASLRRVARGDASELLELLGQRSQ